MVKLCFTDSLPECAIGLCTHVHVRVVSEFWLLDCKVQMQGDQLTA